MKQEPWLSIWKVNRGYIVKRGCQYLVFKDDETALMAEAFTDLMVAGEDEARKKWIVGVPFGTASMLLDGTDVRIRAGEPPETSCNGTA